MSQKTLGQCSDLIPNQEERNYFLNEVCPYEWNLEQDRGRSWAQAIAERIDLHPEHEDLIRAYDARWEEMLGGVIEGNIALLEELKALDIPLYAITNFSSEKFEVAKRLYPFLTTSFIDTVVSADERLLKPDPAIYKVLLDRNQLDPSGLVFIDDTLKNVRAAQQVGMQALHFSTSDKLVGELKQLGVPLP